MPRRLRPMTVADLALLPDPCARCTFWEVSLLDLAAPDLHRNRTEVKREWAEAVTRRWGYCGVIATEGDELLGYVDDGAGGTGARDSAPWPRTPANPDAALLLSTRIEEPYRGRGLGRQLVQAAAGLMVRRDIRAIEAVGSYREGPSCIAPAGVPAAGRLLGDPAAPRHPAAADGPAGHGPLAARSRCGLEPADRADAPAGAGTGARAPAGRADSVSGAGSTP